MTTSSSSGVDPATTTTTSPSDVQPITTGATDNSTTSAAETGAGVGEPSGGLETGAIIGIVVGALCCILLLVALIVVVARRRGQEKDDPSPDAVALDYLGESKNPKSEYAAFSAAPDSAASVVIQYGSVSSIAAPTDVIYDSTLPPASNYGAAPTFELGEAEDTL
jgi:hypothetical protein